MLVGCFSWKKYLQKKWKVLICHFWKNEVRRYTRHTHISQLWNKRKYPQSGRYTIAERRHVFSLASWWNCQLCLLLFKLIVFCQYTPPRTIFLIFEPTVSESNSWNHFRFLQFLQGVRYQEVVVFLCLKITSPGFSTETPMTSFATTAITSVTVCPCWGSQCDGDRDDE